MRDHQWYICKNLIVFAFSFLKLADVNDTLFAFWLYQDKWTCVWSMWYHLAAGLQCADSSRGWAVL